MGVAPCNPCNTYVKVNGQDFDFDTNYSSARATNQTLGEMNILDFETRIKKYASSLNKGFVSAQQLKEAFKDTQIFQKLEDPSSIENKFYLSPFVADFPIGSSLVAPK